MQELARYLIDHDLSIMSCESFTVGRFASSIGSIPGISKVFRGALVTYQSEIKEKILGISHEVIQKKGVVSEEVAFLMAQKASEIMEAEIAISFTGNAGPEAMENKPVGLCYIGICIRKETKVYACHFQGDRTSIAQQAIAYGVMRLKELLWD